MLWPEEATELLSSGRPLADLDGVGPSIAARIAGWIEDPPEIPEPPPERRGFRTLTQARALLESDPSWRSDIRGDLQMHSTWSDGGAAIRDMVANAAQLGHEYIAITDHSKGLRIAHGMDEARLAAQGVEIDELSAEITRGGSSFRVLKAIEMNVSPDGEGDMDDDALAALDLVLGSFHSALRVTGDQTDRYIAALHNPAVCVIGHPRGRKFGSRVGLDADWPRVFAAAAEGGKAVEIDGYPDRQDLHSELVGAAAEAGAWISIGTDSHAPEQLAPHLEFALAIAAEARLPRDRILNFMSADRVVAWARDVRSR